jgi:hypothetical protein
MGLYKRVFSYGAKTMTDRKWMLSGLLAAMPCLFSLGLARAADPKPILKSDKTVAADDQPGPTILRGRDDAGHHVQFTVDTAVPPVPPVQPVQLGKPVASSQSSGPVVDGIPPYGKMNTIARAGGRIWQNDPEMQRLLETDASFDRESRELAEEFRRAANDKQSEIKKKLQDVVTRQFESRQERRSLELKRLEDEIKRIRGSIDKRNEAKKQIVDRRISEVLGQDDTSF